MPTETAAITDRVAEAFVACTLPKAEWTHEAHLRERIRRCNLATGGGRRGRGAYTVLADSLAGTLVDLPSGGRIRVIPARRQ